MAASVLTRDIEPNGLVRFWNKYSDEIIIGAACIFIGLFIWFCIWLFDTLRPKDSPGPYSGNGWGGPLHIIGTPRDVHYPGESNTTYTIKHPADSVLYQDLKGTLPDFIIPMGGPPVIHPGRTYTYMTGSDISVSQLSADILQQFVMPTGSQIRCESDGHLIIKCTWTGGGQTLKFILNNPD
jgi:hypothetical protein